VHNFLALVTWLKSVECYIGCYCFAWDHSMLVVVSKCLRCWLTDNRRKIRSVCEWEMNKTWFHSWCSIFSNMQKDKQLDPIWICMIFSPLYNKNVTILSIFISSWHLCWWWQGLHQRVVNSNVPHCRSHGYRQWLSRRFRVRLVTAPRDQYPACFHVRRGGRQTSIHLRSGQAADGKSLKSRNLVFVVKHYASSSSSSSSYSFICNMSEWMP